MKEGHKFAQPDRYRSNRPFNRKISTRTPFEEAVRKTIARLEGSFAIGVISRKEPENLIGARLGSPLIVGVGKGENFLASDVPAVLDYTKEIIFLDENEIVVLTKDRVRVTDFSGKEIPKDPTNISWDMESARRAVIRILCSKKSTSSPKTWRVF